MKPPKRWVSLTAAAAVAGLTACSPGTTTTASTTGQSPELQSISVGVLNDAINVTAQIADDEGLFKEQEFKSVTLVHLPTTTASTPALLSHTVDFSDQNYVGLFQQAKSAKGLNLRIVADNAQATPDLYGLMVPKGSTLSSPSQLKGKKVACPALGFNYCQLSLDVLLAPYHMSARSVTQVPVPFAETPAALSAGTVDAAFTTEPFVPRWRPRAPGYCWT